MNRRSFIKQSTCAALIAVNATLLTGLVNASLVGDSGGKAKKKRTCTIGTCQEVRWEGDPIGWWCELKCTEGNVEVVTGILDCDEHGNIIDDQDVFGARPPHLCDPSFDSIPGGGGGIA